MTNESRNKLLKGNLLWTALPGRRRYPWRKILSITGYISIIAIIFFYWYSVFGSLYRTPKPPLSSIIQSNMVQEVTVTETKPKKPELTSTQKQILACANKELVKKIIYDDRYYRINYPGGDIPGNFGTSADIVIRCLRTVGVDLQKLIFEDRLTFPNAYPLYRWAQTSPDSHIDHRRVTNLWIYFNRYMDEETTSTAKGELDRWLPGDIVFWTEGNSAFPNHIGIVSDRLDESEIPHVPHVIDIHPSLGMVSDTHLITSWTIIGHFRVPEEKAE